MTPVLLRYEGDGEFRAPGKLWADRCDKQFVVGAMTRLQVCEERSRATHNHYFAALAEGWANLPEHLAERFPTVEHLRKYCLIKAGYHDERSIVCASKAEAQRVAGFVRPMDSFAVVLVDEAVVTVYTAKSQSLKAMGRKAFQDSKTKVLDILAGMIGTELRALTERAARSDMPHDLMAAG